ncbi:MAG: VOC family protein [Bacteroidetes bacterium]|nr:VOC family protein [Bacteroidota bacterium]
MPNVTKNPVNWFEIYVDDIERAKKFYSAVLNVTLTDTPMSDGGKMAFFPFAEEMNAANAGGALCQHPHVKPGHGGTMVYFDCEDCQVEQNRVEAAGGKVAAPKFQIGEYGFCAVCIDSEGNHFGLHSMK